MRTRRWCAPRPAGAGEKPGSPWAPVSPRRRRRGPTRFSGFDQARRYLPGTPFWFADMWSAIWHAPDGDIVQAMLDGISCFAEGKGALNNLVGKPGQSAYEMGEHAYYRGLVQ